jgi:histidinol-phosphatase (PHP family)
MLTSYHNHTTWSDGESTVAALVEGARRAGVTELGVADHFAIAPDGRSFPWSVRAEALGAYVDEVLRAADAVGKAGGGADALAIRLGVEVDYFPETLEESMELLRPYPFDFVIGSVHFVDIDASPGGVAGGGSEEFCLDLNAGEWERLSPERRDQAWRIYWRRVASAARSGCFDFIGHFDLPKKFKYYPGVDLTADALAALDAIAAADVAIEINTSGWHKAVQEAYPAPSYVKEARLRGIPLLINADAHHADHVARDFARARRLAAESGYTEVVRYERRRRIPCPLEV